MGCVDVRSDILWVKVAEHMVDPFGKDGLKEIRILGEGVVVEQAKQKDNDNQGEGDKDAEAARQCGDGFEN